MLTKTTSRGLPHIKKLEPYRPGKQPEGEGWVKLNTNETPYPPSPKVGEAIHSELARLPLYPNPCSLSLREAIAHHHGLKREQVIVGNGSDDILNLLMRCFCGKGRPAGTMEPSYSLYPVLAGIQNAEMAKIPFTREMIFDPGPVAASGTKLFFFTSPHTPTGIGFKEAQIAALLESFHGLLVVDEAYAAFAAENAISLLSAYPNLVVVRSFSKSHGLAGLRVGYALASPETIDLLDRVRDSYNVNRLSQRGALAALHDSPYYEDVISQIIRTRDHSLKAFQKRGWFTYPSQANFIFTEPVDGLGERGPAVAQSLFTYLQEHKILVRYFGGSALTENFLRISIGREPQMNLLFKTIDSWQKNA